MNKTVRIVLRWIAVLPSAILAAILATFILHYVLYTTLTNFITPYPEFPERALIPFVVSITFIWSGFQVAPTHKLATAFFLFLALLLLTGSFIISVLSGGKWFGRDLYFQAGGIPLILGIAGAFVGLLLTWKKIKLQTRSVGEEGNVLLNDSAPKGSFYNNYGTDIFNLIFISLFVFCIFSITGRVIIFCILLILNLVKVYSGLKKKLYTSKTMKINLAKGIIMIFLLLIGILYHDIGLYVSILCLLLQAYDSVRYFIVAHFKNNTNKTSQ